MIKKKNYGTIIKRLTATARNTFKNLFVFCCFFLLRCVILKSFHHIVGKLTTVYMRWLMTRFSKRVLSNSESSGLGAFTAQDSTPARLSQWCPGVELRTLPNT